MMGMTLKSATWVKSRVMILLILILLSLAACNGSPQDTSEMQESSNIQSSPPVFEPSYDTVNIEELTNEEDSANGGEILLNLPSSTATNLFGNRFNGANIVFNTSTGYYYVSQLNHISHWYSDFGINDLAFKTRMDAGLTTRTVLSDGSFEQLQFVDGYMYYISNGLLMRYHNGTEETLVDIIIDDYAIDGSLVYFVPYGTLEIWVKDMDNNLPAVMLPIMRTGMFQAAEGKVFFVNENAIHMYSNGTTEIIYQSKLEIAIQDFLIDGVLVYRHSRRFLAGLNAGLRIAGREDAIGPYPDAYTILGDRVYYVDFEHVYFYDMTQSKTEQLPISGGRLFRIASHNNNLFFSQDYFLGGVSSLFVSNMDGTNFRPVVSVQQPEFQTFTFVNQCHQDQGQGQNFSFSYPIGYIIGDNAGSWRGCCLWLVEPENNLTIWLRSTEIHENEWSSQYWDEFDVHAEGYTAMKTDQGVPGRYIVYDAPGRFHFVFEATDGVHGLSMTARSYAGYFEDFQSILFEIAKSLTIIRGD